MNTFVTLRKSTTIEKIRNYFFRNQVQQKIVGDAFSPNISDEDLIGDLDLDLMWSNIEDQTFGESKLSRFFGRFSFGFRSTGFIYGVAAVAILSLTVLGANSRFSSSSAILPEKLAENWNLKGASVSSNPPSIDILNFRFAVASEKGAVHPGATGMKVSLGSSILFSTETAVSIPEYGLNVHVTMENGADDRELIVSDYLVTKKSQVFSTSGGYIAYTPAEPGIYKFELVAGDHLEIIEGEVDKTRNPAEVHSTIDRRNGHKFEITVIR